MSDETKSQRGEMPDEIDNDELIDKTEKLIPLNDTQFKGWLDQNLKDNLKEDVDFIIVNEEVWGYIHSLFGGRTIKRYATIIDPETDECIIEVCLQKLYVYDIPKDGNQ